MKLAEALANRADVQKRLEQMRGRLAQSALVQENESPPEDPEKLLAETERLLGELEGYVERINRTNLSAALEDGTTLTAALARRDVLGLRYGLLRGLVDTASNRMPRYGRAEIRTLATVEVAPLRRRMDEVAKERRDLDTAIQAANWTTELME
ncbi:MAG: DIP1984 family protein [Rubrobacteraceae bacterium]